MSYFSASIDNNLENASNNVVSNGFCIVIVWFSFIYSDVFLTSLVYGRPFLCNNSYLVSVDVLAPVSTVLKCCF